MLPAATLRYQFDFNCGGTRSPQLKRPPLGSPLFAASFARWQFRHDPARTRAAYAALEARSAYRCDCPPCRNYFAHGEDGLPAKLRALLSELGIDARWPAEVSHYGTDATGRHTYHGWYQFVGEALTGRDGWREVTPTSWTENFEQLGDGLSLGLTTRTALVHAELSGQPLLQLDFGVSLPWVLAEAEPA